MKNWHTLSEFFLTNMTLTRGTPPCTPHMEVPSPRALAIAPCTKSFVNSMGLQFLIFFFKLNVINPRGLVDDIMTIECPEGLERGKNVGKKKRTRSQLKRSLYWYM